MSADTIAAISTAPGSGAIAVVRLSGPESIQMAEKLFRGKEELRHLRSHCVRFGKLLDSSGGVLDEVLVTVMRGPDTYTGEDVVEISCHGGPLVSQLALDALIEAGCRLATPGEFTRRAFLNGKIDLAQAEAVAELVSARTRKALDTALKQLEGGLSERVREVRSSVVKVLSDVEARIDFPDDVSEDLDVSSLSQALDRCIGSLSSTISERASSIVLSSGARIPIVGRPNVGKSSLLNAIVGRSRAIVTPSPGTTRDTIEQEVEIDGVPVRLVDTAGLRSAQEEIEEEGVRRTMEELKTANLIVFVVDAATGNYEADLEILKSFGETPCVIAINKIDIASAHLARSALESLLGARHVLTEISATEGTGLTTLKETIGARVNDGGVELHEASCTAQRHLGSLRSALEGVKSARRLIVCSGSEDLAAFELREAAEKLGSITGERVGPDVLDSIFSRFCVGK